MGTHSEVMMSRTEADAVERLFPGIEITRGLAIDELWRLYEETGFLYPAKLEALAADLPEIRRTIGHLLEDRCGLLETVAARRECGLVGHLCALRAYRKTWVVQHLAALRRMGSSAELNLAITHLHLLRPDVEWIRMSFRPDNPLPMRAFGGYARQVEDGASSMLRTLGYWTGEAHPGTLWAQGMEVERAGECDWEPVRNWFAGRNRMAEFEALDVEADPQLRCVGEGFAGAGLQRGREVMVARRHGQLAGFALCESSSRGMNLSELTNAMTLHVEAGDAEAARVLIDAGRAFYERMGARRVIVLDDGGNAGGLCAAGFEMKRRYTCWTFHRDHSAGAMEHFKGLFAKVRR